MTPILAAGSDGVAAACIRVPVIVLGTMVGTMTAPLVFPETAHGGVRYPLGRTTEPLPGIAAGRVFAASFALCELTGDLQRIARPLPTLRAGPHARFEPRPPASGAAAADPTRRNP